MVRPGIHVFEAAREPPGLPDLLETVRKELEFIFAVRGARTLELENIERERPESNGVF